MEKISLMELKIGENGIELDGKYVSVMPFKEPLVTRGQFPTGGKTIFEELKSDLENRINKSVNEALSCVQLLKSKAEIVKSIGVIIGEPLTYGYSRDAYFPVQFYIIK